MTQINGLGNKGVNWNEILSKVQDGLKTTDLDEKAQKQIENFVMSMAPEGQTVKNGAKVKDIEIPANDADLNALSSLVEKLANDKTFNFSDDELKIFMDTLKAGLSKIETSKANAPATVTQKASAQSSKVLLDIYAMLVLLAECAQEQKNAQRDIRQSETTALATSIQNQANAQRSAAMTGLIAGSIICGLQALATGVAMAKTIGNIKSESQLSTETGVKDAGTALSTAKTELATKTTELNDFNSQHPAPAENAQPDAQLEQQRANLQTKVDDAKAKVNMKRLELRDAKDIMAASDKSTAIHKSQAWAKGISDMSLALGNLGQTMVRGFVEMDQADAMKRGADQKRAEEGLAETKDIMASFQDVIDQIQKLAQAVLQAENQSMRDAIQA